MQNESRDQAPDARIGAAPEGVRKFRPTGDGFRWSDVPLKCYKEDGSHFRSISRQTLFAGDGDQPCELRYFEIGPGGHSTFERHVHTHAVLILRGQGRVLLGDSIRDIEAFDLVNVPSLTWHQFRADDDQPLGFLCQVACDRDRPTRPDENDRREILRNTTVAEFARL